jgi:hypothetical protein
MKLQRAIKTVSMCSLGTWTFDIGSNSRSARHALIFIGPGLQQEAIINIKKKNVTQ